MFGYSFKDMQDRLLKYKVTHISATPTLYKMLLGETYTNVKQVTFGGERTTKELQKKVLEYFPNAKIKNIYASTEGGSLFASKNDLFYIPVKYVDKIKIVNNEIHLHKDIVGESTYIKYDGDWYNTKDLVEFVTKNEFKIVGRSTSVVKIAGYNINIESVESKIQNLEGIKLCKVMSKENSVLGNILISEIILEKGYNLKEIKNKIKQNLEKFETPIKIKEVDSIEINENGKIKR